MGHLLLVKSIIVVFLVWSSRIYPHVIRNGGTLQVGDNISEFALAKILSLKYGLELTHSSFLCSDLFVLDDQKKDIQDKVFEHRIHIRDESDIINNLGREGEILFWTDIRTRIEGIQPLWLEQLKQSLQLKQKPEIRALPQDMITVAVHIRKGNGGGQFYDGEQLSLQYFTTNQVITYRTDFFNYPFDWESYRRVGDRLAEVDDFSRMGTYKPEDRRLVDTVDAYYTKFPPEQYYVDQIHKLSDELKNVPLYIQIFTDDKNPNELVERIRSAVNRSNITFGYEDYGMLSYKERIARDLYTMSQCDVLIRSQSYFARVAEFMGNVRLVIYPLRAGWDDNKLIMNTIVVKGSFNEVVDIAFNKAKRVVEN